MVTNKHRLILVLKTTHQVIGGERKLLQEGITVEVIPKPQTIHGECGVVLSVPWEEGREAFRLLVDLGVSITNLYLDDGEKLQEVERQAVINSGDEKEKSMGAEK